MQMKQAQIIAKESLQARAERIREFENDGNQQDFDLLQIDGDVKHKGAARKSSAKSSNKDLDKSGS